jgi:hypothetical protein
MLSCKTRSQHRTANQHTNQQTCRAGTEQHLQQPALAYTANLHTTVTTLPCADGVQPPVHSCTSAHPPSLDAIADSATDLRCSTTNGCQNMCALPLSSPSAAQPSCHATCATLPQALAPPHSHTIKSVINSVKAHNLSAQLPMQRRRHCQRGSSTKLCCHARCKPVRSRRLRVAAAAASTTARLQVCTAAAHMHTRTAA